MGDSIKAISEDVEDYERLCNKYGEEPRKTGGMWVDPYCQHARILKDRERQENHDGADI